MDADIASWDGHSRAVLIANDEDSNVTVNIKVKFASESAFHCPDEED